MLSPNTLICWFPDAKKALKARDLLDEIFLDLVQTHGYDYTQPTKKMRVQAKKAGFEWTEGIDLGVEEVPDTVCHGDAIVVYHALCDGFSQSFLDLCQARGAVRVATHQGAPRIEVKGKTLEGEKGEALAGKLEAYLTTPDGPDDPWKWRQTPWGGTAIKGSSPNDATFSHKGQVVSFSLPLHPVFLSGVKRFMAKGTKEYELAFVG